MSSRKSQPLQTLSQTPQTPRWKPSTPHGTRAQLLKSGGDRRKSGRIEKPWSAHGILRQLSRVEATKPIPKSQLSEASLPQHTPDSDKENGRTPLQDDFEDDSNELMKPRLSLPLSSPEDEDSNVGPAPTPSILPEEDEETSPVRPDDAENDFTLKSIEYGRRAMPERLDRRFSRPSFGSIRMSDFRGVVDEDSQTGRIGKSPGDMARDSAIFGDDGMGMGIGDDEDNHQSDEIEDDRLRHLRQSMSVPEQYDETVNTVDLEDQDEDTFRLQFNAAEQRKSLSFQPQPTTIDEVSEQGDNSDTSSVVEFATRSDSHVPQLEITSPQHSTSPVKAAHTPTSSRRKKQKLSKHGLKVPSLPSSLIKRLGTDALTSLGRRKSRIGRDSLQALEQATEWFFEQIGEDLEAYSEHAGRKRRVDEKDVLTLMKRQRHISSMDVIPKLAKESLSKDVLREIDLSDMR